MSMFFCAKCDELRDSDEGCEATKSGLGLICEACISEREDDDAE